MQSTNERIRKIEHRLEKQDNVNIDIFEQISKIKDELT